MNNKKIPRTRNDHVQVALSGFVVDANRVVVYLSLVGPKNTAKSIWASCVNNPRRKFRVDGVEVSGGDSKTDGYYQFWQDLPEQMAAHLIVAHKAMFDVSGAGERPFYVVALAQDTDALVLPTPEIPDTEIARCFYRDKKLPTGEVARLAEPGNEQTPLYFEHPDKGEIPALDLPEHWAMLRAQAAVRVQSQQAIESLLLPRFIALLNKSLDIPLHKTWAKALWDAGVKHQLITPCRQGGHVQAAYKVATTPTQWQDIVQNGLEGSTLPMPQPVVASTHEVPTSVELHQEETCV